MIRENAIARDHMKSTPSKKLPTIGCCGIDCGLCPRYYTEGRSRCPGCAGPDFIEKHPSCSIITCCVMTKNLETCASCGEYPCHKIRNWDAADSFVTHRNCMSNLRMIKAKGELQFIKQQHRRIQMLKSLILEYDDGRSKSFFCLSASLLPIDELERAVEKVKKERTSIKDVKLMAGLLKKNFKDVADRNGIELEYRKGKA
jgi:hypothetical protein